MCIEDRVTDIIADLDLQKRFYHVTEVAGLFGVTPRTVYNWAESGRMLSMRINSGTKGVRISRAEIKRFAAENHENM